MDEIKRVKLKTGIQTRLSHLAYGFNRIIKGVKAEYNINYRGDGDKAHTLDIMHPQDKKGLPCVIYIHGGGWCAYDKSLFRSTTKELAARGTVVFNCNVRLAPEYGFADMEEDVASIFAFVKLCAEKYGGDCNKIIVAGDSSGAQLLSLYANRQIQDGGEDALRIVGCAYFYGVFYLDRLDGVHFNNKEAYTEAIMPINMENRESYLAEYSPATYLCAKHPPTILCAGMIDELTPLQTNAYAKQLEESGVNVRTLIFPQENKNGRHRFMTFSHNECAKAAFETFGEFIKTLADGTQT